MLESENQPLGVNKNYIIRFYHTRSETSLVLTLHKSTQTEETWQKKESSTVLSDLIRWGKNSVTSCVSFVSMMVVAVLLFIMESMFYISGDNIASTLLTTVTWGLRKLTRLIYTLLDKRLEVLMCLFFAAVAYSLAAPQIHQILLFAGYAIENVSNVVTILVFGKPRPHFKLRIVHSGNFKKIGK